MDACDTIVELTTNEKASCLKEILKKLNKILYVFDKSQIDDRYNYKDYCSGVLKYVYTSNTLFNGELINVVVNLTSIEVNDFSKDELKRVVFESKNEVEYFIKKYEGSVKEE